MLGTLAKWLRLLGFDTFYANTEITDEELLEIAKRDNRTIISRDKGLVRSGKKQKLDVIEMYDTDLDDQLNKVLEIIKINENLILSRCTICNTILEDIEKNRVKDRVPKKVFENNEKFWFCSKCDKYYWTGSHYDKIIEKINEITKRNNSNGS